MKQVFNVKKLHLGHLAKAFGLRDAPGEVKSKKKKPDGKGGDKGRKRFNVDEFASGFGSTAKKIKKM
jgi:hypothetical protein